MGVLYEVLLLLRSTSPLLISRLQVCHQLILLRRTLPLPLCVIGHWSLLEALSLALYRKMNAHQVDGE
ncbi:unnamed protein product [Gadus morhua 'NCC']